MIRLTNINKTYDKGNASQTALTDVNLTIEDGEMLAIMGTSGSGKTTLLNMIGGMDAITEGVYEYNDTKVSSLKQSELDRFRKEHICFVFQHFALMNDYTVYENVEMPLICKRINKKERKKIVLSSLKAVGILELANKFPSKISGGQKQRCAIARALASGNDIILADEPTGALDQTTGQEVIDILKSLNKEGKTVIIVTHDEGIAKQMNRVIRISDGKVVSDEK